MSHSTGVAVTPSDTAAHAVSCRLCAAPLSRIFVDLGMSPLCERFVRRGGLSDMEPFYPLRVWICGDCLLVQLEEHVAPKELFGEYAYFSSYSESAVAHAERYCEAMIERFGVDRDSQVLELGSNDGYLLQHFVARGIPVLGVEPAASVATAAIDRGVPTRVAFFDREEAAVMAGEGVRADLVIANNVFAEVPDITDFAAGIAAVVADDGVVTLEFPHLVRLIEGIQYDTIKHERVSYLTLLSAERALAEGGLAAFDVEELPRNGGSLRLFAGHPGRHEPTAALRDLRARERADGYSSIDGYAGFGPSVEASRRSLLRFLIDARTRGETVVGYGATGSSGTLLNYCGVRQDLLDYTVDRNPYKHGLFTPGTHIPIHPPDRLAETRPDYILILPWSRSQEIIDQLGPAREWGARFVVPIPEATILS